MISRGMFPLIVFMLFPNLVVVLAIKRTAITFINFGGNFKRSQKDTYNLLLANDDWADPTRRQNLILVPFWEKRGGPGPKTGQEMQYGTSGDPWDEGVERG